MYSRKVILYISASLDGYISKPNDDLSFLEAVQLEGEDYGYEEFIQTTDTIIIGRKTYEWVLNAINEYPHPDKQTYVITSIEAPSRGNVHFYSKDLKSLITKLKSEPGKNIYCDGGAQLVNNLLKVDGIDEIIISRIPIILGGGTPLFHNNIPERNLKLISSKSFSSGLVQDHYEVVKEK